MPRRKRLRRKKSPHVSEVGRSKKTFTYHVGFPPYTRIRSTNGFKVKMPAGQLFPSFGMKVTVRNGHGG